MNLKEKLAEAERNRDEYLASITDEEGNVDDDSEYREELGEFVGFVAGLEAALKLPAAKLIVATMSSEKCEFIALGNDEAQARAAMAAEFDKRLKSTGDESRERSLYRIVEDEMAVPEHGHEFGQEMEWFAAILDEWYGIATYALAPGEGTHN